MRSRADDGAIRMRAMRVLDAGARVAALGLIALCLWRVLTWQDAPAEPLRVEAPLIAELPALSLSRVAALHVPLREAPNVVERDWLVALRRAGTGLTWSDAGLPPAAALSAAAMADPAGGASIAFATNGSDAAIIDDMLGILDSVIPAATGARLLAPSVQGSISARRGSQVLARAHEPVPRVLRPVLVTGSAGWEAKFVIAALEERGWTVHGRLRVSPTAEVSQVRATRIDTASYSAVIVLDSASAPAADALLAYVRRGGGLVLAGDAGRLRAFTGVAPARLAAPTAGALLRSAAANGREGLPMHPLVALRPDAIAIDERDGRVVVAARREGAGRIVLVGETESWRWRMAGPADAPAAHRQWWSRVVASAAYAPLTSPAPIDPESAPHAALVHALGEPGATSAPSRRPSSTPLPSWLGASILTLLLLEWASRRLRGER